MPPGTLSADSWWVWDGAAWVPALSADGMWRWDGTAWIPVPAAWEAPQPARGRARPAFVAATILVVVALIAAVALAGSRSAAPQGAASATSPAAPTSPAATVSPGGAVGVRYPGAPAGTTVFPDPQPSHTTGHVDYPQSPPVGGPHSPVWLNCGVYTAPVPDENAVHSLEHGVVWVTYDPSLTATGVNALRTAVQSEYSGTERLVILSPYPGLRSPVVASAWGVQIRLDSPTDPRLRAFIEYFRDGPETPEHGGRCTGGTGRPADPAGTPDAV